MFTREDRGNFWILNWLDEFMIGHNGFICGGCFKNIFNKKNVKDIDMFFESKSDYEDAVQYFDSMTPGYDGDDKRSEEYTFYYENDKQVMSDAESRNNYCGECGCKFDWSEIDAKTNSKSQ